MLYSKNQTMCLDKELFQNPSSEYRGTPFWAWNGKLEKERLSQQIQIFKKMGFGGFHMHVRTGMESPYLDQEFMEYIRHCIGDAEKEEMLAWLYDEDRWPSGTAGGRVTAGKPENARKSLLFTVNPYEECEFPKPAAPEPGRGQENIRQENGRLLAVYDIVLNEDGTLKEARRLSLEEGRRGADLNAPGTDGDSLSGVPDGLAKSSNGEKQEHITRWYAYMEYASADPWFNNQAYVDTLNPDAIKAFIELTHEAYYRSVGEHFGKRVPAIFTDEPQFTPRQPLDFAREKKDVFFPWTTRLPELYRKAYGEDLMDVLPQLLWELPEGRLSQVRWRFQNLLTDLFIESYCSQIGDWCREHNLYLTGHVMGEGSLYDQTQATGDAMRCYPSFGLPGIDMLCDFHEYNTAKQTQSMVHQTGAEGMLSELYGVTGWDYDFRGYKLQGDWQAALGVTVRVPHLAWYTMKGEAKRDYPAAINYQSPWWEEFSMVENHFARLNTALTRGKARVKTAVLHPVETYWLYFGPGDQTGALREQMEDQFRHLAETLLFGCIDFDYLCEAKLPEQCQGSRFPLQVGQMAYETIIVPPVRTIRSTTLKLLKEFAEAGGKLLFLGACPDYVDALPSDETREVYDMGVCCGLQDSAILAALESERFLDIRKEDGRPADSLIHQLRREENGDLWLFICNGKNPASPDVDPGKKLRFTLAGTYKVTLYDTMTGEIRELAVGHENGKTLLETPWYIHTSMLLLLHEADLCGEGECRIGEWEAGTGSQEKKTSGIVSLISEKVNAPAALNPDIMMEAAEITLQEPNMLLLDMAEYSLNGGEFYSLEELLRIDNHARRELGIPMRRKEVMQPYLDKGEEAGDSLQLRFRIPSERALRGLQLGLECPENAQIRLNGGPVSAVVTGWYVDRDIQTISLPDFVEGENLLEITVPIGRRTNLEYFYLLGDFGVRVNGTEKTLTAPVRKLGWGDITCQGLPFYTGNLIYKMKVRTEGDFTVRVPQYRGGLVKVLVDGRDCGNIVFSPYTLTVSAEPGEHILELKLYGTRQNGFAQLHHTQGVYFYQSPNSWRSAGDLWSYEYRFKQAGILKSPELRGAVFVDAKGRSRRSESGAMHITDRS